MGTTTSTTTGMTASTTTDVDLLAINTLRFLAVDMVEKAASGHPGAPLGQAPLAYLLWTRHLRFDPGDPRWPDRDRFVLSCGHASALLYALLHLAGYDLPLAELERFRQLHSRTPGHPEHGLSAGVETTTGPLGQGLGNAVGMAIGREMLKARFDRPGHELVAHRVWVLASDGDMMEGVASEAASLAGHLRLGCLKVFYDDNQVSIDGPTALAFSEDVGARYRAYGWRVLEVADGNDLAALVAAIAEVAAESERPSLVVVRTQIGYGSPKKQGTSEAHGEPLGAGEARATKQALGWPLEPAFHVPAEARAVFAAAAERGRRAHREWRERRARWSAAFPELGGEYERRLQGRLPDGWDADLPRFAPDAKGLATREASGKVLEALSRSLPELVGGSADLTPSNKTLPKGEPDFSATRRDGRYLRFGVREHAMGAALSGIALSGMLRPYGGTFLVFSDYMRPAVRLAAMMEAPVVYVYTHDSLLLGEDGPTHQPESHLLSLRALPGLVVLRPADAVETVEAWRVAMLRRGPTALALTRQKVPTLAETAARAAEGVRRGAYVLADPEGGEPHVLLLATGSEVELVLEAQRELASEGIRARVVSFPSWELFEAQDEAYRSAVLPAEVTARLAVEAGTPIGWHRYVGARGAVLGLETFGASAPYRDLAGAYGFTVAAVIERTRRLLAAAAGGRPPG
jgi:transketolase